MLSSVKTYTYPNGEIQRVQSVLLDSFDDINFFVPSYSDGAFSRIVNLYRNYIVPKQPLAFGNMLLFKLDDSISLPDSINSRKYGLITDRTIIASVILNDGLRIINGKPHFRTSEAKSLYYSLFRKGYSEIVCGRLPHTKILPVNNEIGYMSESYTDAKLKVNSNFFIMDCFDCATVYDSIGSRIGLTVKDGIVSTPPSYNREALLIYNDGHVTVSKADIHNLEIKIGDRIFNSSNSKIYTRPQYICTPKCSCTDIVITGTNIKAIHKHGRTHVPSSGFVLSVGLDRDVQLSDNVTYSGFESVKFGIQVGNSAVIDNIPTKKFISRFYNIRTLGRAYPPSLYPLNFKKDRAPRIAIGTDSVNHPVIVWAEGAGKLKYEPGHDSCGASLSEMSDICADLGLSNAVNLDGGGSAQILINNIRELKVSDRNSNNIEQERAIPIGLLVN